MTSHTNEAVLRRFYDDAFSKGKLSVVDELADRNFVDHDTPLPGFESGAEGLKQFIGAIRTGFPDLGVADSLGLLTQLGVIPPPGQSPEK